MKKEISQEKQSGTKAYIMLGLVLSVGLLVFLGFAKDQASEEIPDYLEGKWCTTVPRYEERFLEISKVTLVFATGSHSTAEYFISKTARSVDAGQELFLIESKNIEGEEYRFSLIYQADNGGTLFFKNQPEVKWSKETL